MKPILSILLLALLGVIIGYGVYLIFLQPTSVEAPQENLTNITPPAPPENITEEPGIVVTYIEAPDCRICSDEGYVVEQANIILLQHSYVEFEKRTLQFSDPEATILLSKYNIQTVPAVVVEGPIEDYPDFVSHWEQTLGSNMSGSLVSAPMPPYYSIELAQVIGILEGISINADNCTWCADSGMFLASLQSPPASFVLSNSTTYYQSDPEAQQLIEEHNISKLPTVLLKGDVDAYPIYMNLGPLGDVSDGWYVLRTVPAPYLDLTENKTKGLVKAMYLTDQSCTGCFDAPGFASFLAQSAALLIEQETYFDINATGGSELAKQYNISKVPTLLLSPDADEYPFFKETWTSQGNTVEEDGWYVFRAHDVIGVTYRNFTG